MFLLKRHRLCGVLTPAVFCGTYAAVFKKTVRGDKGVNFNGRATWLGTVVRM